MAAVSATSCKKFKLYSTTHCSSPLVVSVNTNNIIICLHHIFAAQITQKPSSVIVEEGENVTLVGKATGQPTPTILWRKAFGHVSKANIVVAGWNMTILSVTKADSGTYASSVENLLSEDSAVALVTVIDSDRQARIHFGSSPYSCCKRAQQHSIKLCSLRQKRYSLGTTEQSTSKKSRHFFKWKSVF